MNRRKKRRGNIGKIFLRKTDQPENTFFRIVWRDTSDIVLDNLWRRWKVQIDCIFGISYDEIFKDKDKLSYSQQWFLFWCGI